MVMALPQLLLMQAPAFFGRGAQRDGPGEHSGDKRAGQSAMLAKRRDAAP
jgi:hypothetical protein